VLDLLLVVNRLHRKESGHRPFFSLGRLLLVAFQHVVIKYRENFSPAHKNIVEMSRQIRFFADCKRIKNYYEFNEKIICEEERV